MKRFTLFLLFLLILPTVTVSCTTVDTVRFRLVDARVRVEIALGIIDEEEAMLSSQYPPPRKNAGSTNLGYAIASLSLFGIVFLAIAAMVLSNKYV